MVVVVVVVVVLVVVVVVVVLESCPFPKLEKFVNKNEEIIFITLEYKLWLQRNKYLTSYKDC